MAGGYCSHYRELKDKMKAMRLKYADVAPVIGISIKVLQNWMNSPEEPKRWEAVNQAISYFEKSRTETSTSTVSKLCFNRDFRIRMKSLHITQDDLALEMNCERHHITYLLGMTLPEERRSEIDKAITSIAERRQRECISAQCENHTPKIIAKETTVRKTVHNKTTAPQNVRAAVHGKTFISHNLSLPWKERKVNDERGTGDQN